MMSVDLLGEIETLPDDIMVGVAPVFEVEGVKADDRPKIEAVWPSAFEKSVGEHNCLKAPNAKRIMEAGALIEHVKIDHNILALRMILNSKYGDALKTVTEKNHVKMDLTLLRAVKHGTKYDFINVLVSDKPKEFKGYFFQKMPQISEQEHSYGRGQSVKFSVVTFELSPMPNGKKAESYSFYRNLTTDSTKKQEIWLHSGAP